MDGLLWLRSYYSLHQSGNGERLLPRRRSLQGGGVRGVPEPEDETTAAHGEYCPRWLRPLLSAHLFASCAKHATDQRRNRQRIKGGCGLGSLAADSLNPPPIFRVALPLGVTNIQDRFHSLHPTNSQFPKTNYIHQLLLNSWIYILFNQNLLWSLHFRKDTILAW
jgi:hypothetical protein